MLSKLEFAARILTPANGKYIVGIVTTNTILDSAYLQRWAARPGVTDRLEKAQTDSRLE
jgi:hypothetical protein